MRRRAARGAGRNVLLAKVESTYGAAPVRTSDRLRVNLPMSWQTALGIVLLGLRHGNAKGREVAVDELKRMAKVADRAIHLQIALTELVRLKGIKRRIDTRVAKPEEREDYTRNKEAAWHAAERLL